MTTKIEKVKLSEIHELEDNPRWISKDEFERLKKSIKDFPEMMEVREIVVDETGAILGGNQRYKALLANGETEATVKRVTGWTDKMKREFVIKDNHANGEWDTEILANNYDPEDLKEWMGDEFPDDWAEEEKEIVEDDVPEPPEEPKAKLGDIYQLGDHRLMCGDSTKQEDVEKLMDGAKADIAFTSPPYNNGGNAVESGSFSSGVKSQKLYGAKGYSDNLDSDKYINFCETVLNNCIKFTNKFVFWNVNYNANSKYEYIAQIVSNLSLLEDQICWEKHIAITNTSGGLTRIWEPIYVFSPNGDKLKFKKNLSNFWEIDNVNSSYENHRACFPIKLPAYAIENIDSDINTIFDPFGGSGTTLMACEQLGRKCYMMELDPHYVDVIVQRWENFTGEKAVKLN